MLRSLIFLGILCSGLIAPVGAAADEALPEGGRSAGEPRASANQTCGSCGQIEDKKPGLELTSEVRSLLLRTIKQECSAEEGRLKTQFAREVRELIERLAATSSDAPSFSELETETKRKIEELVRLQPTRLKQLQVECKMEYAKVLNDEKALKGRVVRGMQLETYSIKIFTHCALSAKGDQDDGMQIEMIPVGFGDISQYGINANISIFGFIKKGIADIYKFPSLKTRKQLYPGAWTENVSYPICSKEGEQRPLEEYKSCLNAELERYSGSMVDPKKKSYSYDPFLKNCCHFVDDILSACGLTSCFGYPYSSGLDLGFKRGALRTR